MPVRRFKETTDDHTVEVKVWIKNSKKFNVQTRVFRNKILGRSRVDGWTRTVEHWKLDQAVEKHMRKGVELALKYEGMHELLDSIEVDVSFDD